MTFTDEAPPTRDNPVAPAQRSTHADAKAHTQGRASHFPDCGPNKVRPGKDEWNW